MGARRGAEEGEQGPRVFRGDLTPETRRAADMVWFGFKERRSELGAPSNKLNQWLSLDVGVPEALVHLGTVVGLMKLHTDYDKFERQLNQIAPTYPEHPGLFDDPKDWEPR